MMQECYLRNKGKTTPKPKKWHKALADCHFLGCGVVLPEFLNSKSAPCNYLIIPKVIVQINVF